MAKTTDVLVREFNSWLLQRGVTSRSEWYFGISADPRTRLMEGHGLEDESGRDHWKYDWAVSNQVARAVEEHFIVQGYDGGTGGGDLNSTGVYVCYKSARFRR